MRTYPVMDDMHRLAAQIARRFLADSQFAQPPSRLFLDLQQLALLALEGCRLEQRAGELPQSYALTGSPAAPVLAGPSS